MAKEGRRLRIVIIPILNMDGRERFHKSLHLHGIDPAATRDVTDGRWKTGETIGWPECMLYTPMPVDRVDPLGSYFNDNGVDLAYDFGFAWEMQPETRGLVALLREERPDGVLFSHSDNGSLVQPPDAFVPPHFRQRQAQIGALVGARCLREGMKKFRIPTRTGPHLGYHFYQMDMAYHCCGALPLCVEFPCGYQNYPDNHGEILDIGMYALEEVIAFGASYGFRPPDPRVR